MYQVRSLKLVSKLRDSNQAIQFTLAWISSPVEPMQNMPPLLKK